MTTLTDLCGLNRSFENRIPRRRACLDSESAYATKLAMMDAICSQVEHAYDLAGVDMFAPAFSVKVRRQMRAKASGWTGARGSRIRAEYGRRHDRR